MEKKRDFASSIQADKSQNPAQSKIKETLKQQANISGAFDLEKKEKMLFEKNLIFKCGTGLANTVPLSRVFSKEHWNVFVLTTYQAGDKEKSRWQPKHSKNSFSHTSAARQFHHKVPKFPFQSRKLPSRQ